MRRFSADVGNLAVVESGKEGKPVKKHLEVDFIYNKGSKSITFSQLIRLI